MHSFENRIIAVVGPEGSGKSTITKRLAQEWGLPRIYPGDLLRNLAKNDPTELGDAARRMFEEHTYFPPHMLIEVMRQRFLRGDLTHGFVLDGAFRTVQETRDYPTLLKETELDMPVTIVALRIPGWLSVHRLVIGDHARRRADDTPEGVLSRLSHFYDQLGPRMKVARDYGWSILHVRAIHDPEKVYNDVVDALRA